MATPAISSKSDRKTPRKGSLQRNESKRNRRHRKRMSNKAQKTGNGGVIDMTESTDDSDDDDQGDIEIELKFLDGLVGSRGRLEKKSHQDRPPAKKVVKEIEVQTQAQAGPSNSGSIKGKEKAKIPPAPVQAEKEEITSSFKPMSRSIMSGWKLSLSRSPSPPAKRARTDSPQIEIFVDEKPDPTATLENGDDQSQPPAFSTSLIPRKKTQRKLREEEQKHAEDEAKEEANPEVDGDMALLLPEHITLESAEDRKEEALEEGNTAIQDAEGLHILDDSKAKGVQRYFDPEAGTDDTSMFLASADQSRICMTCKRPGHNQRDCPHVICPTCGKEDEHERRDCPYNLICFRCGLAGHKIQDCSKPRTKGGACDKCGASDHTAIVCPMIWRMYSYYSEDERRAVQEHHAAATGWAKEAVRGGEHERWCYNCAQEGHFGDDCPRSRGSLARFTASAFSKLSQSRGPFAASNSINSTRTSAQPVHQRWDASDDDDDDNKLPGQVTPFAGLGAGRKTIEKRKRAAMDQERQFGGSEPRHPKRKDGNGGGNGLPFGHRHFMTPSGSGSGLNGSPAVRKAKDTPSSAKIQFGKLSMPGESQGDTPKRGSASTTLVNRALRQSMMNSPKSPSVNLNSNGNGSTSSPLASTPPSTSKRRRKKKMGDKEEGEIEEVAFRSSGLGGGKVEGWGRELDEEEKKAKKVGKLERKRTKEGNSATAGNGVGGGLSIKGRSQQTVAPGQKYHGSY